MSGGVKPESSSSAERAPEASPTGAPCIAGAREEFQDLADRLAVKAAQYHALAASIAADVAELATTRELGNWGFTDVAGYLTSYLAFTPAEAQAFSRAASATESLPHTAEAAHRGRLSVGMLGYLGRAAAQFDDARLAEIATTCTPAQAYRVIGIAKRLDNEARARHEQAQQAQAHAEPAAEETRAEPAPDPRFHLHGHFEADGTYHLRGVLPATTGALLESALDRFTASDEGGTRLSRVEALGEIARHGLTADLDGVGSGSGFEVVVTCELGDLLGRADTLRPVAELLGWDAPINRASLEQLLATSPVRLLVTHNGEPLWLGRSKRTFSRAQRLALRVRYRGRCATVGCERRRGLQFHHLDPWAEGGRTDINRGVPLCPRCHHRRGHSARPWPLVELPLNGGVHLHPPAEPAPAPPPAQLPPPEVDPTIDAQRVTPIGAAARLTNFGVDTYVHSLRSSSRVMTV